MTRRQIVIQAAGVIAALNIGKVPPALSALRQDFGMSLVEASFLVSMLQVAGMAFGVVGGVLADRFGPRRVMMTGLMLLVLASSGGSFTRSVTLLMLCRALESAGFILTVLGGPALLRRSVPSAQLTHALGWWSAYMPTGMSAALILTPFLMGWSGWPLAWWLCSAMAFLSWLALWQIPHDSQAAQAPVAIPTLVRDTLSTSGPWWLGLCFGLYAGQFLAVFGFLPTVCQDAGLAPQVAGFITAMGVAVNIVGCVLAGPAVHRFSRSALIGGTSLVMLLGAWLTFSDLPGAWRLAGVMVFSGVGGLIPGVLFITAPRFAPYAGAVATTTGFMQQGSAIGQFIAPPLVAYVATQTGHWQYSWWVTGAFALANVGVGWAIGRRDRQIDVR